MAAAAEAEVVGSSSWLRAHSGGNSYLRCSKVGKMHGEARHSCQAEEVKRIRQLRVWTESELRLAQRKWSLSFITTRLTAIK